MLESNENLFNKAGIVSNVDTQLDANTSLDGVSSKSSNEAILSSDENSEEDYIVSEDDNGDDDVNMGHALGSRDTHGLGFTSSLSDHATYLTKTLSFALESFELDKSLVLQAQLSGKINNENQNLIEKEKLLIEKIENIRDLYTANFATPEAGLGKLSRVSKLKKDISDIESRIDVLTRGKHRGAKLPLATLFVSRSPKRELGVANKYPIEYNQARDKVLERQIDRD